MRCEGYIENTFQELCYGNAEYGQYWKEMSYNKLSATLFHVPGWGRTPVIFQAPVYFHFILTWWRRKLRNSTSLCLVRKKPLLHNWAEKALKGPVSPHTHCPARTGWTLGQGKPTFLNIVVNLFPKCSFWQKQLRYASISNSHHLPGSRVHNDPSLSLEQHK